MLIVLCVCAFSFAAPVASASSNAPAALPPDLLALEHKMATQPITSLRFSATTSVIEPHPPPKPSSPFSKLFGGSLFGLSGEIELAPPAANLLLTLFGHPLSFRVVGKTTYLYLAQLAARDRGRPWVEFGPQGLSELATIEGPSGRSNPVPLGPQPTAQPQLAAPPLASPPFTKLTQTLATARTVTELGPGVVNGQPVTRFLANLYQSQIETPLSASALRARRRAQELLRRLHLRPVQLRPVKHTITLEASLDAEGVPVRIVIANKAGATTSLATLNILAVNFPLSIEAPPAAQTITVREAKTLERRDKHMARGRKSKQ